MKRPTTPEEVVAFVELTYKLSQYSRWLIEGFAKRALSEGGTGISCTVYMYGIDGTVTTVETEAEIMAVMGLA